MPKPKGSSRVCLTCTHAKTRCNRSEGYTACDRCRRLRKECHFLTPGKGGNLPVSVLARKRVTGESDDVDASHDPLDSDMQQVAGSSEQHLQQNPIHLPTTPSSLGDTSFTPASGSQYGPLRAADHNVGDGDYYLQCLTERLVHSTDGTVFLARYKTNMIPRCPFVPLSEFDSIQELYKEKPFLCTAILSVSSWSHSVLQRDLSRHFWENISQLSFRESVVSLDILQALLVFLTWAHYQPFTRRCYTQQLQLAASIVVDLRLDIPPVLWQKPTASAEVQTSSEWIEAARAALIGVWYLVSCSSTLLKKMNLFPYSRHVESCCQKLGISSLYRKHILAMLQAQHLTEKIAASEGQEDSTDWVQQVMAIRESIDFPIYECPTLSLHLFYLEIISHRQYVTALTTNPSLLQTLDSTRLMSIIVAVKGMLNWYLSIPANQDHDLTNLEFLMMNQALILAARLDLLVAPSLRSLLDLQHTYRQIILRLEAAAARTNAIDHEQDVFQSFLARCQKLQLWWLRCREQRCEQQQQQQQQQHSVEESSRLPAVNQEQNMNLAINEAVYVVNMAEFLPGFEDFNWEDIQCDFLDG